MWLDWMYKLINDVIMTSLFTFVNALASFLILSNTLLFLKVFCALRGSLIEIVDRNLPLIQQYDVKMTSNYVIVSIKFTYLDVGDDVVVCNFNNEHIVSQPTALPHHFSLTGHL